MPQAKHAYTPARKPRLPASLTPHARKLVDDAMCAHWRALEALTAFLDAADGDDLEDEHDGREPDFEDEGAQCDDEGAYDSDREPSLGAYNPDPDRPQLGWANNGQDDMQPF